MMSSFNSLAVFVIAGAIAAVALAVAIQRLHARGGGAQARAGDAAAPRTRAPIAIFAAAATGLLAMGLGFYTFFSNAPPPVATTADTAGTARADLARHLERTPDDGRAWVLLARIDFAADRFADAAAAYERALAASPKVALDAGVWCEYADALGMAQGGSLTGRPRELVMRALAQNPAHPKALEMAGSAAYEAGEYGAAVQYWRQLLPQLANDPGATRELAAAIARAEEKMIPTDPATGEPAPRR
jgi:cytochrome c-type biogenesis protein CcmH